jgi:hypothetical protein
MDEQTMKDYIEDLLQERAHLYNRMNILEVTCKQLAIEMSQWRRAAIGTFFDGELREVEDVSYGEAEELMYKLVNEYA